MQLDSGATYYPPPSQYFQNLKIIILSFPAKPFYIHRAFFDNPEAIVNNK